MFTKFTLYSISKREICNIFLILNILNFFFFFDVFYVYKIPLHACCLGPYRINFRVNCRSNKNGEAIWQEVAKRSIGISGDALYSPVLSVVPAGVNMFTSSCDTV